MARNEPGTSYHGLPVREQPLAGALRSKVQVSAEGGDGNGESSYQKSEEDVEHPTFQSHGPAQSRGAALHPIDCTPCAFYCFKRRGCAKGEDCAYCHMAHTSRQRQRRDEWKRQQLARRHGGSAGIVHSGRPTMGHPNSLFRAPAAHSLPKPQSLLVKVAAEEPVEDLGSGTSSVVTLEEYMREFQKLQSQPQLVRGLVEDGGHVSILPGLMGGHVATTPKQQAAGGPQLPVCQGQPASCQRARQHTPADTRLANTSLRSPPVSPLCAYQF
mmetsp:Transcript_147116/g.409846  ORF Transcript_147116/g.409846 Transcript_147116/m.409846 type:complete len:271 (+) Transcript_147116:70-882(+)